MCICRNLSTYWTSPYSASPLQADPQHPRTKPTTRDARPTCAGDLVRVVRASRRRLRNIFTLARPKSSVCKVPLVLSVTWKQLPWVSTSMLKVIHWMNTNSWSHPCYEYFVTTWPLSSRLELFCQVCLRNEAFSGPQGARGSSKVCWDIQLSSCSCPSIDQVSGHRPTKQKKTVCQGKGGILHRKLCVSSTPTQKRTRLR